jgi:hypothetical protein
LITYALFGSDFIRPGYVSSNDEMTSTNEFEMIRGEAVET